jgi:prolyl oligopeptidase
MEANRMTSTRKRASLTVLAAAAAVAVGGIGCAPPAPSVQVTVPPPPETRTVDVVDELHGVQVADPYRWLEDQQAPETREWIEQQNSYTDEILEQVPGQDELRRLVTQMIKTDSVSVPRERGGRYFYSKRAADEEQSSIWMRSGLEGAEQLLIDPNPWSEDHTTSVSIADISDDGSLLAYSVREGGVDETVVRFLNVVTGEELADRLPRGRNWGIEITPDNDGVYYSKLTAEGPRVLYHELGTATDDDPVLFGEDLGPEKIAFAQLSDDGSWLLAHVIQGSSGPISLYLKDLADDGDWVTLIDDSTSRSQAQFAGSSLVISTDLDAPKRRVMRADLTAPTADSWVEVLPESDAVLEGVTVAGDRIIAQYLRDVQTEVQIVELDGTPVRELSFDFIGAVGGFSGQWGSNEVFYSYSSFHVPTTIYRYDLADGSQQVWADIDVPIDSDAITVEQEWATSTDGAKVPMFIVHRKDMELDGAQPTLVFGYGGFNATMTPYFNGTRALWVERGGVYVLANLRGGGELGEAWHRAGMLESKQNTFDDLYAVLEHLIERGYTSSEHLGIMGGSNGGLLVGAAMTQRPELMKAVICVYPLLDMVRYHKFLVARFWVPEYGSSEDPEQFEWLYSYSPYHNVEPGVAYPATLFITGDGDTRVAPLHARKMTAMVQAHNEGDSPIMLRYHTKAGHSGGMPVEQQIEDGTEILAFLSWQLGL